MHLTRRDLIGTAVTAAIVVAYAANAQGWWYLGSNRAAAITMLAVGFAGCPLAARLEDENLRSAPIVALGALGVVALALGVVAIVTAEHWALLALVVVVLALWVGTTLRHAMTPVRSLAAR